MFRRAHVRSKILIFKKIRNKTKIKNKNKRKKNERLQKSRETAAEGDRG